MSKYSFINIMVYYQYLIDMVKKKRTRNIEEKIDLIYKTFFDLVLEKGYTNTTTNHIAETAQISIGTVYRYFPNGKSDIIINYFERAKNIIFDIQDFSNIKENNNLVEIFENFIRRNLKNHKENLGYNMAFHNAIMSDKELLEKYNVNIVKICTELARELRSSNLYLKTVPENRLIKVFVLIFNLIQANTFHHLFINKMFDDDDYFISFLSNLVEYARGYIQKKNPFIIDRNI